MASRAGVVLGWPLGCPARSSFVETLRERRLDDQKLPFEIWGSRARTTGCRQANELLRNSSGVRVRGAAICRGAISGVVRVPAYEVPGGLVQQIASGLETLACSKHGALACAGSAYRHYQLRPLHVRSLRCTSSRRTATFCNEGCIELRIALALLQAWTLQALLLQDDCRHSCVWTAYAPRGTHALRNRINLHKRDSVATKIGATRRGAAPAQHAVAAAAVVGQSAQCKRCADANHTDAVVGAHRDRGR